MTINLKEFITQHEGKRNMVYQDALGIPTIGVGFNLQRTDAELLLSQIGANYDIILNGDEPLTNEQIDFLLDHDIQTATTIAKNFINNFDEQPDDIQKVLIDMSFNLGYNRLNQFQKFKKAVEDKKYQQAAKEMINSKWYNQVKNRGKELVEIVKNLNN